MTETALALVSFFVLLGPLIDEFRKNYIVDAYVFFEIGKWNTKILTILELTNKAFDRLFGEKLFSFQAFVLSFSISAFVNFIIWADLINQFGELSEINDIITREENDYFSCWRFIGIVFFGGIHDYISLLITRLLLKWTIKSLCLWALLLDGIASCLLFMSSFFVLIEAPWIIVGIFRGFGSLQYWPTLLFSFKLFTLMWKNDMYNVISGSQNFLNIALKPDMIGYSLCSITVIIPTWYYILRTFLFAILNLIYFLNNKLLLLLSKGPKKLYTNIFNVCAIVYVICAKIIDWICR